MIAPFRADQVGSFIRPQSLLEARSRLSEQPASLDARAVVRAEQERAIREVVKEQLSRGILPITSGEYERFIFYDGFFDKLSGFEKIYKSYDQHRPAFPTARTLKRMGIYGRLEAIATGPISLVKSPYLDDWLFLRSQLPQNSWGKAKMTLPSPNWYHIQLNDGEAYSKSVYPNDTSYFRDVVSVLRQEILILYDHGLRVVQIDDPNLMAFCDDEWVKASRQQNIDLEYLLETYIKAHNDVLKDLPSDLYIGIHLCRGNFPQGVWVSTGSYEDLATTLFRRLNYKIIYLEFDSSRAGDFTPLKELPVDKAVVLGLVTTKAAELEDLVDLKRQVHEAADTIAQVQGRTKDEVLRDNLAVSPQCGFASVEHGMGVGMSIEKMWQKLELIKRLADDIWPEG